METHVCNPLDIIFTNLVLFYYKLEIGNNILCEGAIFWL